MDCSANHNEHHHRNGSSNGTMDGQRGAPRCGVGIHPGVQAVVLNCAQRKGDHVASSVGSNEGSGAAVETASAREMVLDGAMRVESRRDDCAVDVGLDSEGHNEGAGLHVCDLNVEETLRNSAHHDQRDVTVNHGGQSGLVAGEQGVIDTAVAVKGKRHVKLEDRRRCKRGWRRWKAGNAWLAAAEIGDDAWTRSIMRARGRRADCAVRDQIDDGVRPRPGTDGGRGNSIERGLDRRCGAAVASSSGGPLAGAQC